MGSKKSLKVLVTGGGGFVGLALIRRLVEEGYAVSNYSRSKYQELTELSVNQHLGDLSDFDTLNRALIGQDIVFHVAAKAGFWGPYNAYHLANVVGTENIIKACKENKVEKLIFTSSASVVFGGKSIEGGNNYISYPNSPLNAYTATKALAEQAILEANSEYLKTIALRPHIIWGPGDRHIVPRIIDRAKKGKLRIIGDGKNKVDTIYIDNLIDAHLLALDALDKNSNSLGKAYFITNDEPVLLWEFLNRILTLAKIKLPKKSISQGFALFLVPLFSGFHKLFRPKVEPSLSKFLVKELSQSHWFDISDTKKDLNYSPKISLEEGLKKLFKQ